MDVGEIVSWVDNKLKPGEIGVKLTNFGIRILNLEKQIWYRLK